MTEMDIGGRWRSMRADPAEAPRPGAHQQTAGPGITISVAQQCQVALPLASASPVDEVSVTVTSHRPGVAAQVSIGANLNSPDGSYQGPTTTVGQGQFTATGSQVHTGFVVLRAAGWPVLGVGAEATWADGAPASFDLTYVQLACDPLVWWQWLIRIVAVLTRPFSAETSRMPPRST
jgi:hypothetical protein